MGMPISMQEAEASIEHISATWSQTELHRSLVDVLRLVPPQERQKWMQRQLGMDVTIMLPRE